ncbi:MAG: glycosyltransferase [Candidatus Nitrosopolaris sp.]
MANYRIFRYSLPFVSIIIPARNEEENIRKCLISLLSQSYPNFEVIAIDDSSTDNTLQIMNKIKDGLDTDSLFVPKPGTQSNRQFPHILSNANTHSLVSKKYQLSIS